MTGRLVPSPGFRPSHRKQWRQWRPPRAIAREMTRLVTTQTGGALTRLGQRISGSGEYGAPIVTGPDRTVLLFYEDVERDRWLHGDRHLRRAARRVYHAATIGQTVTGVEVAFRMLCTALERAGCRVVVNNWSLARRHPEHPVGICGYPHILDDWTLPNPAVLGPGLLDLPQEAPALMQDPRFRTYFVPCAWMHAMFAPVYGAACRIWFAGIDPEQWPNTAAVAKDIDLLVYEKILWQHEEKRETLVAPLLAEIERRGLRCVVVRRGAYTPAEYRKLLARSRGMLFICEHETQGLAYQEALASNIPVLAWDPGVWLDPIRLQYTTEHIPASSVPYFSTECGERFHDIEDFPSALDRFLARLPVYQPRAYVTEHLSLERSAAVYLDAYVAAAS